MSIGDIYYYGITGDDSEFNKLLYKDNYENEYEKLFLHSDTTKFIEYKVKLINIRNIHMYNNLGGIVWDFEILEIIHQEKWDGNNKVGSIVTAYDLHKYCNLKNKSISFKPQCGINDGGSLNCSGCYKSLVIPIEKYIYNMNTTEYVLK
jgi:hypothetical protein